MAVTVIDSVMGTGKTTNMIRFMEENPDKKYLYISPFKTEVGDGNTGTKGRLQLQLPDMFPVTSMPKNAGDGKLGGLKRLLGLDLNIATTHSLFSRFDEETTDTLLEKGYVIIIDEAIDCIDIKDDLTVREIKALVDSKWITVEEGGDVVRWNEDEVPDYEGRYQDVKSLASTGSLRLFEGRYLVTEYPPKLLKQCKECYIMSYLFKGSLMSCWMDANGIDWYEADLSTFGLVNPKIIKSNIREQLTVLSTRKLDNLYTKDYHAQYRYSSTWYKKTSTLAERLEVKKALESCVSNHKTSDSKVFWTTFKVYKERLEGKGYKKGYISPDTGVELDSFLPYTTKAINDYRYHDLVMHTVNLFRNPVELRYFESRGVKFDEDKWALSELLQFVWRSRIREGQPTKVLVVSKRMRKLLTDWLEEDK